MGQLLGNIGHVSGQVGANFMRAEVEQWGAGRTIYLSAYKRVSRQRVEPRSYVQDTSWWQLLDILVKYADVDRSNALAMGIPGYNGRPSGLDKLKALAATIEEAQEAARVEREAMAQARAMAQAEMEEEVKTT